ncbi:stAR-related lipid transfer protein 13-like [Aphis gossypii]|nr:stAR-related lipid transfer protein 13-like [Aphis gossypii]
MFCKRINIFKAIFKCKDCTKICHRKCHMKFVEMELKRKEELEMCVDVTPSDTPDKTVFGVPLIANVQKYGSSLPPFIQTAFRWLEDNALDHRGLFRKSGNKSQIHQLRQLAGANPDDLIFENHEAYDVADMVKQYFRELPEPLFTNKLSECFIDIFQHVPVNLQKEAVYNAVLLLPDEHREALFALLDFLCQVSSRSDVNKMTASNLAICMTPSLFNLSDGGAWSSFSHPHHGAGSAGGPVTSSYNRLSSVSSCRNHRKSSSRITSAAAVGIPDDLKRVGQNCKAAHDCLLFLIEHYRHLFAMAEDIMSQCHFSNMDESIPMSQKELVEMGQVWRGYWNACTLALLKEVKDNKKMADSAKNNDTALEWLKLKTDKGRKPDYQIKAEMEDVGNKFLRKFKENPLVPIGALVTVGFLGVGLKSMYDGNRVRSQMMMRGRIAAQGFTVVALLGGLFYQGMAALKEAEDDTSETGLK